MNRLAIIVGHTATEQGAKATHPINKTEYEFNNDLSIDLYRYAREAGLDARIFKRDGKTRVQLGREVNEFGGVAIELHLNAFDKVARGTETLYDALPKDNEAFAKLVHSHIVKALKRDGKRDRGTMLVSFKERGWLNLHAVAVTGCLVEPVFCDNIEESRLLWKYKTEYAKALVNAVLEWYCIERD